MKLKKNEINGNYLKTGVEGLDEIIKGFPRGGLVIVSGSPGTGKTTLAASFIYHGATKYGEPGVYASLIEDERRFYQYMSGFGLNFEKLREEGLFRYLALPTMLEPGIGSVMNLILESVESIDAKRLVIDSYTAISQMFESQAEARTFLHTCFSKITKQLGCTTILIREESISGEKSRYGFEEFIADGLIHLRMDRIENKLVREMTILKMRGCRIENPDACITLHQGFKVLPPTKITIPEKPKPFKPPPDPQKGYSTGIPDLDKVLGGLPDKSTTLLEVDPKITPLELLSIGAATIASCIYREMPCLYIPSGGTTSEDLRTYLKTYGLSDDQVREYLKLPLEEMRIPVSAIVAKASPEKAHQLFEKLKEYALTITKNYQKPPVRIIGVDKLAHIFGEYLIDIAHQGVERTKKDGGLLIWVLKPTHPWISERLAPLADIHLKITRRHGCMLIYGIKPRTPLYAIQFDKETPIPKLLPIL